jgi:hypothetical protein
MSTTPTPVTSILPTSLLNDWKWLTTHLILVGVLILVLLGGVYEVNAIIERHDAARQSADAKVLAQVVQQTASLQAALDADQKASAVRDAAAQQTINTLLAQISSRDAQLKKTIQQNATLTAAQAAQKLTSQTGAAPGQITAVGNTVVADLPTAIKFVDAFDQLTALQADLVADAGIIDETNVKLNDANKNLSDATSLVASQKTQLADADKVCKDKIATTKAKERKHSAFIGFITFVAGLALGHRY